MLQETIERDLPANAERVGAHLRKRLEGLMQESAIIGEVRGKGLLNAIELVADRKTKAMLPRTRDVPKEISDLARPARAASSTHAERRAACSGDWLMMTPPLIATVEDVDDGSSTASRAFCTRTKATCAGRTFCTGKALPLL